jgi:hypothetical protein
VDEAQHEPNQSSYHSPVESNELQVWPDARLNLVDEVSGVQGIEILSHGHTNLMVIALDELSSCTADPVIKRRAPLKRGKPF